MIDIIGTAGFLMGVFTQLGQYIYRINRKSKIYFKTVWKNSSLLEPDDIIGTEENPEFDFREYSYESPAEGTIKRRIERGDNVMVFGSSKIERTRAIYQSLIALGNSYDVIVPRPLDIDVEDFQIPLHFTLSKKSVLVIDDLHSFVEKHNFNYLLDEFRKRKTPIIASCSSDVGYDELCCKLDFRQIFGQPVRLSDFLDEDRSTGALDWKTEAPLESTEEGLLDWKTEAPLESTEEGLLDWKTEDQQDTSMESDDESVDW